MQTRWHGRQALILACAVVVVAGSAAMLAGPALGDSPEDNQPPAITVAEMIAHSPAGPAVASVHRMAELFRPKTSTSAAAASAHSGPSTAGVVVGAANAQGFNGLDLVAQENAGKGKYKGTNGGLEPPDQALCVGNGFVIEGVNLALRMYNTRAVPLTPAIPIVQFFALPPNATVGAAFVSDPRCIYDAATGRFFVNTLEVDEPATAVFGRAHNYFAVSKTSDPTKGWYVYSFDVSDDGLMGTPLHATCPCLGDQPLMGTDANGLYLSDNEFSNLEVLPVQLPPAVGPIVNSVFSLPDFRNGQAQVYAMSKDKLIHGHLPTVVRFDTATSAVPAGSPSSAIWSSLQPAFSPPGDHSVEPASGVEYFMSQLDFGMSQDNRVAVWAATNTASLNAAHPSVGLVHTIVTTVNPSDKYHFPVSADQKAGPTPMADSCLPFSCNEEKINANDDRMNEVMLTNGNLWSGVNNALPPIKANGSGAAADIRTGIMYFEVHPQYSNGHLTASMVRDGYVQVPRENVLFPSIGASPSGPVIMGFTLSGVDYYPSAAWAELDGLAPGQVPVVHVSKLGRVPEDGFTGYCDPLGLAPLTNIGGLCTPGISRWGDYSFSGVDEQGCIWTATEYISGGPSDPIAGNWATYVTRIVPPGCHEPDLTPSAK